MIIVIAVLLLIIVLSNPITAELLGILIGWILVLGACLLTFAGIMFALGVIIAMANG